MKAAEWFAVGILKTYSRNIQLPESGRNAALLKLSLPPT